MVKFITIPINQENCFDYLNIKHIIIKAMSFFKIYFVKFLNASVPRLLFENQNLLVLVSTMTCNDMNQFRSK